MSYYHKYQKYKKKYLQYKLQTGGNDINPVIRKKEFQMCGVNNDDPESCWKNNCFYHRDSGKCGPNYTKIKGCQQHKDFETCKKNNCWYYQQIKECGPKHGYRKKEFNEDIIWGSDEHKKEFNKDISGSSDEHKKEFNIDDYYLVHNYFRQDIKKPFKILFPMGYYTSMDKLPEYVPYFGLNKERLTGEINKYKSYVGELDYPQNIGKPPHNFPSNIGVYFWFIPKSAVDKMGTFVDINKEQNNFSYIFEARKLINYLLYEHEFKSYELPLVYWEPDNFYGTFSPLRTIIIGSTNEYDNVLNSKIKSIGEEMVKDKVCKSHEVISLLPIYIERDKDKCGFVGIKNRRFLPTDHCS